MVASNFDVQPSVENRFRLLARLIEMPPKRLIMHYYYVKLKINYNSDSVHWL